MKKEIRIGTRESLLAVAQAQLVRQHIITHHPDVRTELVKIKTTGDKILDQPLDQIGGKGLFVKELERALLENRIDLAVHSLKDMPMEEDEDYPILGFSHRELPNDVLVLPQGCRKIDLSEPIGTSSPRRILQLQKIYPGCQTKMVRGNIVTRLRKLDDGEYGSLVLAAAGLIRLGMEERMNRQFTTEEMVPAAGQGILAVQGRRDFDSSLLYGFFDEDAKQQALAERSFVSAFGGGCSLAAAAYASVSGNEITLTGLLEGDREHLVETAALTARKEDAILLGNRLAEIIRNMLA